MERHSRGELTEKTEYAFEFRGSGREYFGIWVVNLILTILTLGVYSAWAKVRTNRYFYGNTLVAGSAFDYTANPKKILAGRAIAALLFVIYQVCFRFFPSVAAFLLVAFILVLPIIYLASISFRMRYSQWRGINFSVDRDIAGVYRLFSPLMIYIILLTIGPFIFGLSQADLAPPEDSAEVSPAFASYLIFSTVVVLGGLALFPLWQRFYYNFIGSRINLGKSSFELRLAPGKFYSLYLIAFAMALSGGIIVALIVRVLSASLLSTEGAVVSILVLAYVALLFLYLLAFAFIQTRLTNVVYSGIKLEGIEFESRLRFGRMLALYSTNALAIIISLGTAIPWAKVRMARYRAENMFLTASNLDEISAQADDEVNAGADAMSDIFDLDIGL